MNGISEHNGTLDMAQNTKNIGHRLYIRVDIVWFAALVGAFWGCVAVLISVPPAHAQGPLVTPTPYPQIESTRTAAQAQLDEANLQQAQAEQLDRQASEMRRNAEAQQAAAQQAINDTRAAAAAQNAVQVGEAIGRAESVLNQLRDTVAGQADLIATANATTRLQAQEIISLTNEVQFLRVDKQTITTAYAAAVNRADEAEKSSAGSSPIMWIVIVAFIGLCAVVLIVVLSRKPSIPPQDAPPLYEGEGEVIDQ
jgi:hypothetical protein